MTECHNYSRCLRSLDAGLLGGEVGVGNFLMVVVRRQDASVRRLVRHDLAGFVPDREHKRSRATIHIHGILPLAVVETFVAAQLNAKPSIPDTQIIDFEFDDKWDEMI